MRAINKFLKNKKNDIKIIQNTNFDYKGTIYTQYIEAKLTAQELADFNGVLREERRNIPEFKMYFKPLKFGETYTEITQSNKFISYFHLGCKYLRKNTIINIIKK